MKVGVLFFVVVVVVGVVVGRVQVAGWRIWGFWYVW